MQGLQDRHIAGASWPASDDHVRLGQIPDEIALPLWVAFDVAVT